MSTLDLDNETRPDRRFMVDIETTGVDPETDVVLEIAIVEMTRMPGRLWTSGRVFRTLVHSDRTPGNNFARRFMREVYAAANATPPRDVAEIRAEIVAFFSSCGADGRDVRLCGLNLMSLDVPFLVRHGFLVAPGIVEQDGREVSVGDFHYRVYEISGAINVAADVLDKSEGDVRKLAEAEASAAMPNRKKHTATDDCLSQIHMLNAVIRLLGGGRVD